MLDAENTLLTDLILRASPAISPSLCVSTPDPHPVIAIKGLSTEDVLCAGCNTYSLRHQTPLLHLPTCCEIPRRSIALSYACGISSFSIFRVTDDLAKSNGLYEFLHRGSKNSAGLSQYRVYVSVISERVCIVRLYTG